MQSSPRTLSIQEVSRRLNVTKHTLRFWEKELDGVIVPLRTKGGQRRYTAGHLLVIEEIKRLKRKGLSLGDIKRTFDKGYRIDQQDPYTQKIDDLANHIAETVRSAIYHFLETESP